MDQEAFAKERLGMSLASWQKEAAEASVRRLLGPGRPLDPDIQQRMEALLGRDLSEVRIHDTLLAGEIAKRLQAEAFTVGSHVFAAPERLTSMTPEGLSLLAHELTHVAQQTQPSYVAATSPPPLAPSTFPSGLGFTSPAEPLSLGTWPDKAPLQMQLAPEVPTAAPDLLEAQALASEQTVQKTAMQERTQQTAMDPHEIADRVYRLMRDDLRLERERKAFW